MIHVFYTHHPSTPFTALLSHALGAQGGGVPRLCSSRHLLILSQVRTTTATATTTKAPGARYANMNIHIYIFISDAST